MLPYRGDFKALEELKNLSVVVRDKNGLRNIKTDNDFIREDLYFIDMIYPIDENYFIRNEDRIVKKGECPRCFKFVPVIPYIQL